MTRGGGWQIEFLPAARRELLALRDPIQDRIRIAIRALADDAEPADSIEMRDRGTGLRRLRVGNYRVIYRVQDQRLCVLVIRIGHRSDVYRGFDAMP